MDFRDVYSVNVPVSDGEVKSAKYIMDSNGTTIWSAQEDFSIGRLLVSIRYGSATYIVNDDVTVVGRYGDPYLYGSGTIAIYDVDGSEILNYNDGYGDRRSLFYRCKKGMKLYVWGGGSDGGVAMWHVLGNYHVVVRNDAGEILKQNTKYAEKLRYNVFMTDGVTKIGSFKYD